MTWGEAVSRFLNGGIVALIAGPVSRRTAFVGGAAAAAIFLPVAKVTNIWIALLGACVLAIVLALLLRRRRLSRG